jgi:hypothetical protein
VFQRGDVLNLIVLLRASRYRHVIPSLDMSAHKSREGMYASNEQRLEVHADQQVTLMELAELEALNGA